MSLSRPSRARAAALLASLSFLLACADDAPSEPVAATTAGSPDFCDAVDTMLAAFGSGEDPSAALAAAVEVAPGTVGEDLLAMGDAFAAAAESGDEAAYLADDLRRIASQAQGAIASTCDYQTVELTGTEYAFGGLPADLEPGKTAIRLTNAGDEVHELLLYRRADGTTGDLVDIVNEDPTVSDGRLEELGVMLPAGPGEDSVLLTDLAGGDYVVVCFFPVGTTAIDQVGSDAGGDPNEDHRSAGMIDTFTVD